MFGLGGTFRYGECGSCGALHLLDPPADLSRYYPANYYSFGSSGIIASPRPASRLRRVLCEARNKGQLFGGLFRPLAMLRNRPELVPIERSLRGSGVRSFDARILDVGCGSGTWLRTLRNAGLTQLEGCDPFAKSTVERNLTIHSCSIGELPESSKYDCIVFSHSLEHVRDQVATLAVASRLLAQRGRVVIRVPVARSQPYEDYGADWIELDAPRHFVLHTSESMRVLAGRTQLRVLEERQDGSAIEFWGSELYRRGLTLVDEAGQPRDRYEIFSQAELEEFEHRTELARVRGKSGRSVFILEHAIQ